MLFFLLNVMRTIGLLGMVAVAGSAWIGTAHGEHGEGEGHASGGLEFALKPKGLGQAGQFQFSVDG